jgi:hypothetical protein
MKTIKIKKIEGCEQNILHGKIFIPYKNKKKEIVWRLEGDTKDMKWPGLKIPKWASDVIFFNDNWYWAGLSK